MSPLLRNVLARGGHVAAGGETSIIALGSNVGNRADAFRRALQEIGHIAKVRQTSFLYESPPMYVKEQPAFLNAACQIETDLEPLELLQAVKHIEQKLGRDQKGQRFGPRPIDLDIVTYGEHVLSTPDDQLVIPHPRLAERDFVLRPLCDIDEALCIPQTDGTKKTAVELLSELLQGKENGDLIKVTPTNTGRLLKWGSKTLLMGIVNATPDSFSDGGENNTVSAALRQAEAYAIFDFDVIDIGGQSTRPGAEAVGAAEELKRVLPITDAIRQEFPSLVISADTFHASVASEMVAHGAGIINDVSAGRNDSEIHETVRNTGTATVQMHMRGTPKTMQTLTQYDSGVAHSAGEELRQQVQKLLNHGVPRWSVIADAGIGFAKTAEQSASLARHGRAFQQSMGGLPTLVGLSRKSWLGPGTVEERDWATAGAIGAAVMAGGVDMVRVHRAEVARAVQAADLVRAAGV